MLVDEQLEKLSSQGIWGLLLVLLTAKFCQIHFLFLIGLPTNRIGTLLLFRFDFQGFWTMPDSSGVYS